MAGELIVFFKMSAGKALSKLGNLTGEWIAKRKASKKANRGEPLAMESGLYNLVKKELEKLAKGNKLTAELKFDQFRDWLLFGDNPKHFTTVLIARAGDDSDVAIKAEEQLTGSYERVTQESRKYAPGRIEIVVNLVYGQIIATPQGKQSLELALAHRNTALLQKQTEQLKFPSDPDIVRARAMAKKMLDVGKISWKMPDYVAPLTLFYMKHHTPKEQTPPMTCFSMPFQICFN